jgi:FlaA1/EpsC-like NDP-sugar epimerase
MTEIVIEAAAMTHVDPVEDAPVEAVTTTALGTQHVIETAIDPAYMTGLNLF